MSDPTDDPSGSTDPKDSVLDVEAERERLDDLGERIEDTRRHAKEDLEPGGPGRTFTDRGVAAQVESSGDTHHPPGDR